LTYQYYFAAYKKPEPLKDSGAHTYQFAVFKQGKSRTLLSRSLHICCNMFTPTPASCSKCGII